MTKLAVTYPDVERAVCDLLETLVAPHEPTVTIGVAVPDDWTIESAAHLQVVSDGISPRSRPVIARAAVRVVVRAASTTEAKRLAALAEGLLLAHRGGDDISSITPLAGVLPARDPDTNAELASVSVSVTVRSIPIEDPS